MQGHACGPATAVGFFRLFHECDVRHVLPGLSLPVLVLAPSGDRLAPARATAALIPDAAVHALPIRHLRDQQLADFAELGL